MADIKIQANGNIDYWWIPAGGIVDPKAPTAAEINAGLRLTAATAWDGTTFPNATDSNDIDDRSLEDAGNVVTRGYAQMEADSTFFYPTVDDLTSDYRKTFTAFRTPRANGYLVTRVLQRATAPGVTAATAGDIISVFRVIADTITEDVEGEDSYKFAVSFLPQGVINVHAIVAGAGAILVTGTPPTTVGDVAPLTATIGGVNWTQGVTWTSSDSAVATVSPNGVVVGVSGGTTSIVATKPGATDSTATAVTIA